MRVYGDDGQSVDYQVTGLDRQSWSDIVSSHPPRDTDPGVWNADTFPPALIAACTGVSRGEAKSWWDEAPMMDAEQLFTECVQMSSPGTYIWATNRLKTNSRMHAEVEAAIELGIAPSVFRAWSTDDQDYVLAAIEMRADRCPGCNVPKADQRDPSAWTTDYSTCLHCKQRQTASEEIPDEQRSYTHVSLVPLPRRSK